VDVIRDLLDQLVVDRNDREMGRVDGIVMEITPGRPPAISSILIGASALGERLHPAVGRWAATLERWFGVGRKRPVRIDAADIRKIDRVVALTLSVGETSAGEVERRLKSWLLRLPGSK
jgi:sporulation protein YlmC with PRC-barrel domain